MSAFCPRRLSTPTCWMGNPGWCVRSPPMSCPRRGKYGELFSTHCPLTQSRVTTRSGLTLPI